MDDSFIGTLLSLYLKIISLSIFVLIKLQMELAVIDGN